MKKLKLFYIFMFCLAFCSCDFKCSVGEKKSGEKSKTVNSADDTPLNGAVIKNDIDLEATGVKLAAAYLVDGDMRPLTENISRLNEKIYVIIETDTGWVKENGKSFVGVAERISTSAGRVILDAADIFKDYEITGIDAADAKYISISAVITEADPGVENFEVKFRLWDKKGAGEIKGKYKFHIRR